MADDLNIVDTPIGDLTNLANAPDDALLVVEYLGKAYNSTLGQLKAALGAITSFKRTQGDGTPGSTDVYTVTFANGGKLEMPIPIAKNGTDAVSPTAEVTETDAGWHIVIADKNGKHPFDITNGKDGKDGVSPTAKVTPTDTGWNVVITDKDGPKSFALTNGKDGKDGTSVTAGVSATNTGWHVAITDKDGEKSFDLLNGLNGKDGVSPDVSVQQVSGGYRITITDKDGAHYFTLKNGESSSADWAQKYPDGAGYVKHRPIYKDVYGVNGKVIEASVNFTSNFASVEGLQEKALAEGGKYIVSWNGKSYLCEGKYDASDGHYIGNLALLGTGALDTGEPFYIMCLHDNVYSIAKDTNTAESISVIVTGEEIVDIKKLPWWGVPEGYPYREVIKTEIIPERIAVSSGAFGKVTSPVALTVGSQYIVNWGGEEYSCEGKEYVTDEMTSVCIGDVSSLTGGESTGEPFAVVMIPDALAAELGHYARIYKHSGTLATKISVTEIKDVVHPMDKDLLPPDLGGGVTDYNKLENKPVGETVTHSDTLEWDGNTDGLASVMGVLFKVSDAVPTKEDCANGITITLAGETMTVPGESIQNNFADDGFMFAEYIAFVPTDNYYWAAAEVTFSEAGVYFASAEGMALTKLVIPGYTFTKTEIEKLDMKFLPEGYPYKTVEWVEVLPETTVEIDPDTGDGAIMDLFALTVGNQYKVIWNGAEYTCTAQEMPTEDGFAFVGIGDIGLIMGGTSTGEPFVVVALPNDMQAEAGFGGSAYALDGSTSATVSITAKAEVVHEMAGEYLPGGVPYAEPFDDVVMAAWPANVISSGGYEYFTDPVGKVVEGCWYKVTLGGVVYETIARRDTTGNGFVLGNGQGDNYNLLYGDFPFTIDIFDKPVVADGVALAGGIYLEDEVSTDDFSVRGSLKVQEIHERCLPKTATPLIVRCGYDGVADVPYSVVRANAIAGRAVYLYRFIRSGDCDIYSLASVGTAGFGMTFASIVSIDAGRLNARWAKWEDNSNIIFGEHRISTTTE